MGSFHSSAENYDWDDLPRFTTPHPDAGQPFLNNTLLIGSAGTGKSMVLRQACWSLRESTQVFPLYVNATTWTALPIAEAAAAPASRPATVRACAYAVHGAALGIIAVILKVLKADIAYEATRIFHTELPQRPDAVGAWIEQQTDEARNDCMSGVELSTPVRTLPDLREVIARLAAIIKEHTGRRLLLLLDQFEAVNAIYFTVLRPALVRHPDYTLVAATRPSPSAPSPTRLSLPVGDCDRVWLGREWVSPRWPDFLLRAAIDTFGRTPLMDEVQSHAGFLCRLVGPSTRHFMRIVNVARNMVINEECHYRDSIARATDWMKHNYESELVASLEGYRSGANFLRQLQEAVAIKSEVHSAPPARLRVMSDEGLYLEESTQRLLRVAVREGLLVPSPPEQYGLDEVLDEYSIVPLPAVRVVSPYAGLDPVADECIMVSERVLRAWDRTTAPAGGSDVDSEQAQYGVYLLAGDDGANITTELRRLLAMYAVVTIGANFHRIATLDAASERGRLARSHLVAINASATPRPLEFVVSGWAIGLNKPLIWPVSAGRRHPELPHWVGTYVEAISYAESLVPLASRFNVIVDAAAMGDSRVLWLEDDEGNPLVRDKRDVDGRPLIVGDGKILREVVPAVNRALSIENQGTATIIDTGREELLDVLPVLIRGASSAPVLSLALSGHTQTDALALLAAGVYTAKDNDRVQRGRRRGVSRQIPRELLVYGPANRALRSLQFLLTLPNKTVFADNPLEFGDRVSRAFAAFREKV